MVISVKISKMYENSLYLLDSVETEPMIAFSAPKLTKEDNSLQRNSTEDSVIKSESSSSIL